MERNRSTGTLHEVATYKNTTGSFAQISNPPNIPAGQQITIGRTYTGNYMSLAVQAGTTKILVYTNNGNDTFTDITANLSAQPNNTVSSAWHPSDTYMACGSGISPYVYFYSVSGTSLTQLASPSTLPPFQVNTMQWSPNGTYLALTTGGQSPYCMIYKNNGDNTFTAISLPSPIAALCSGSTWSADSKYVVFVSGTSPYLMIYRNNGDDTFTKLTNPTLPASTLIAAAAFSPNGNYLILGSPNVGANTVMAYQNNGNDTFTQLASLPVPTNTYINLDSISWSPDNNYLAVGLNVPPSISASSTMRIFKNNGDGTFSIQQDISY